ncbi:hypothetical protein VTK26DRAFT_4015 [Humicola hyalothermophila]
MASQALAYTIAFLLAFATAAPHISFQINSQVPPVARIDQPSSFVFSPSTFTSSSPIRYSLANPPTWLSLDSDERRLYGIPRDDDAGPGLVTGVPVKIVATDDSGSTSLAATLVISRGAGPVVEIPLEKQIPDFGTFSGPSSILAAPGESFSFELDSNTFSKPAGSAISYYAVTTDNTPLPAWISFDPGKLSFSGKTPPQESLVQPPQRFPLKVVASDVVGFAGASLPVDIIVGSHRITASNTSIALTASPGTLVSYTQLKDRIQVDGNPATSENILIAATPNIPPWLSIDNKTWHITGVCPQNAESTDFAVTLQANSANALNLTIAVEVASKKNDFFVEDLPALTVTAGQPFAFDLRPYLVNPHDTEISVGISSSDLWIQFNASTGTLFGNAPAVLEDAVTDVKATARDRTGTKTSASVWLRLVIRNAPGDGGLSGGETTDSRGGHDF